MLVYTVLLFPLALAPWALGLAGAVYAAAAAVLGLLFILAAVRVWFDSGERAAQADVRLLDPLSLPAVHAADRRSRARPARRELA